MIKQLIFTSSPIGLEPGRTGYCTVARDRNLSARLVREIERISVLDFSASGGLTPKVAAFRFLQVGSNDVCLLSRIRSSGYDYTNRTNYIAHHLIIDSAEIADMPTPAQILAHWDGWLDEWSENPRYLDESSSPDLSSCGLDSSGRSITWFQWGGDEKSAEIPMRGKSIFRINPGDEERLLLLFAESSAKFESPNKAWQVPFTTFLQPKEDAADFVWIGGWANTPVDRIEIVQGANFFDLDPFDDEMAALALPPEEEAIDDSVLTEEAAIAETPSASSDSQDRTDVDEETLETMPEEETSPIEQADEEDAPAEQLPEEEPELVSEEPEPVFEEPTPNEPFWAPQERERQPEYTPLPEQEAEPQPEVIPEIAHADYQQPEQEATYQTGTSYPEGYHEGAVPATPQATASFEPSQASGVSTKEDEKPGTAFRFYWQLAAALAACLIFLLSGIFFYQHGRLSELERQLNDSLVKLNQTEGSLQKARDYMNAPAATFPNARNATPPPTSASPQSRNPRPPLPPPQPLRVVPQTPKPKPAVNPPPPPLPQPRQPPQQPVGPPDPKFNDYPKGLHDRIWTDKGGNKIQAYLWGYVPEADAICLVKNTPDGPNILYPKISEMGFSVADENYLKAFTAWRESVLRPYREKLPEMVRIPAGKFLMGSPPFEEGRKIEETQHEVTILNNFLMGKYKVSKGEWISVMGNLIEVKSNNGISKIPLLSHGPWNHSKANGSIIKDYVGKFFEKTPVNAWYGHARKYCDKLTELHRQNGLIGKDVVYRLPTEVEWEYALRAETKTAYFWGNNREEGKPYGLDYRSPSDRLPNNVGTLGKPNPWGLHDLVGPRDYNEFIFDKARNYEEGGAALNRNKTDPVGETPKNQKVSDGSNFRVLRTPFSDESFSIPLYLFGPVVKKGDLRSASRPEKDRGLGHFRIVLAKPIN